MAASRGATVAGVDASERLIEVASRRARAEGAESQWYVGDVSELPFDDNAFDGAVSVFGVIFAADPHAATSELRRVVVPGGAIVLTAWVDAGPIMEVMGAVRRAVSEGAPEQGAGEHFRWSDHAELHRLFGRQTEITEHGLSFSGTSPAAWLLEQATFHPVWLESKRLIAEDRFEQLLDETTAILSAANEDPDAMRATSPYIVVKGRA